MERAPEGRRPWLAIVAFGYVFLPLLGGIVVVAAGMKLAVVTYEEPATLPTALFLALGVAAYAVGLALFRLILGSGPAVVRLAIGIVALPTVLIGLAVTPVAQLGALVAILALGAVVDAVSMGAGPRPAWRRGSGARRHRPAA